MGAIEAEEFRRLKIAMITAPVLQLPSFHYEFIMTANAFDVSVCAILQQDLGRGLQRVCYDSQKLNSAK